MGSDITVYAECYSPDTGRWSCIAAPNDERCYNRFRCLCGMRGTQPGGVPPVCEPRGLPPDYEDNEDDQVCQRLSISWATLAHLKEYVEKYPEVVEARWVAPGDEEPRPGRCSYGQPGPGLVEIHHQFVNPLATWVEELEAAGIDHLRRPLTDEDRKNIRVVYWFDC